jgi:hypothetical protein
LGLTAHVFGLQKGLMRTICSMVFAVIAAFAQQDSNALLFQTFAKDVSGWTATGDGAEVHTTSDAARARPGHSSLEFSYDLAPRNFSGAVLGAPESFAHMQSLRFWARSDHNTAVGVLLTEKKPGGGNYAAWFSAPANTWQSIELTPADFTVTDGPNDPVDADGKLDLDQVEGIAVFDLAQFFSQWAATARISLRIAAASGRHSLLLDSFELSGSAAPRPAAPPGIVPIDLPGRDFLQWVTPGGMDLKPGAAGGPLGRGALQATYPQTDGRLEVLVRRVANPQLAQAKRLVFDVASERECTLIVAIEMTQPGGGQGPRFTMPVYPPGGREVFHVDLKLEDFQGTGHFDPARWRTLAILDTSGGAGEMNTLWIGNVQAAN